MIDALRSSKLADVERAFDDRLRAAVPEARLAAVWKEATSDKGAFVDVRITQPRSQSDPFHQKLT
jgi:hypothetical protein